MSNLLRGTQRMLSAEGDLVLGGNPMSRDQNPRQKLRALSARSLHDAELLSILIEEDQESWPATLQRANAYLQSLPEGLASLRDLTVAPAAATPASLSLEQATTVAAAIELGFRAVNAALIQRHPKLTRPEHIARHVLRLEPENGSNGLFSLDARLHPRHGSQRLTHRETISVAMEAFLERASALVLWIYRDQKPEVHADDLEMASKVLAGCQWLELEFIGLVVGPEGSWVRILEEEESIH